MEINESLDWLRSQRWVRGVAGYGYPHGSYVGPSLSFSAEGLMPVLRAVERLNLKVVVSAHLGDRGPFFSVELPPHAVEPLVGILRGLPCPNSSRC